MYDFSDFFGNDAVTKRLCALIANDKFPHSVILDAAAGSGKKLLGNTVAKALLCKEATGVPCNKCVSCITFDSGNNPDVFYIKPEKTRLGMEEIRGQIVANMDFPPYMHRFKVFVIDGAHNMTIPAQNALLKTIEEPKSYGIFILLSENASSLMQTVLSRCVLIRLAPLDTSVVKRAVTAKYGEDATSSAALYARGSIGRALAICGDGGGEDFFELRNTITRLLTDLAGRKGDVVCAFSAASEMEKQKERLNEVFDISEVWFRDIWVYQEAGEKSSVFQSDYFDEISRLAKIYKPAHLNKIMEAIYTARERVRLNGNTALVLGELALEICGA